MRWVCEMSCRPEGPAPAIRGFRPSLYACGGVTGSGSFAGDSVGWPSDAPAAGALAAPSSARAAAAPECRRGGGRRLGRMEPRPVLAQAPLVGQLLAPPVQAGGVDAEPLADL